MNINNLLDNTNTEGMEIKKYTENIIDLIILLISFFIIPGYNLFFKMLTTDSLISAIHFIRTFFSTNISDSIILDRASSLFKGSVLDRYIIYLLSYLFYCCFCWFFWVNDFSPLYFFLFFFTLPKIINRIVTSQFYNKIREKKEEVVKIIIAKQFTMLIKFFGKTYIGRDVSVKSREILPLLRDYHASTDYFVGVFKNVGVILMLSYLKGYSPNFYYRMLKYVYNYKTGELIISYNIDSAKEMLNDIIDRKRWGELLKPNVYNAIILLYQINEEKTDYIKHFVFGLNYNFIKMFTVWTIASLVNIPLVVPLISLFLIVYKKGKQFLKNDDDMFNLIILILGSIIGLITNSIFLTSFICQFGYGLVVNVITIGLLKIVLRKTKKRFISITKNNSDIFLSLISIYLHSLIIGYTVDLQSLLFMMLHGFYIAVTEPEIKKIVVLLAFLLTGALSDFAFLHMTFNFLFMYILLGSINFDSLHRLFHSLIYQTIGIIDFVYTEITTLWNYSQEHNLSEIKKLNSQEILKSVPPITDSQISNDIFEMSNESFIKEISVKSEAENVETIEVKSDKHSYSITKSSRSNEKEYVEIIDKFRFGK